MIAKQVKGCGFRGTLNYLLQKPEAQLIGGNMLGETARELSSEFAESRKLRPNLEKAVYHASLSLAPGENFSDEKWRTVASHYTKEMGFEGSQYTVVRHKDTDHDHVHIVASRIRMDGTYVSDSQDYKRSEKVVRGLEIDHGLKRVPGSHEVLRRAPTGDELRATLRTKIPSARMQLQGLIDRAIEGNPSVSDFFSRLESMGVEPIPNIAKTGHVSGITYRLDKKEVMKGSDLGRGYSWQGIQKRGVTYGKEGNKVRDSEAIDRAAERRKTLISRELNESQKLAHGTPSHRDQPPLSKREELNGIGRQAGTSSDRNGKSLRTYNPGHKDHERLGRKMDQEIARGVVRSPINSILDKLTNKETDSKDVDSDSPKRNIKRPTNRHSIFSVAESLDRGRTKSPAMDKLRQELQKAHDLSKGILSKNVRVDSRGLDDNGPDGPDRGGPKKGPRISRGGGRGL